MPLAAGTIRALMRLVTIGLVATILLALRIAVAADDASRELADTEITELASDDVVSDEFAAAELPPLPTALEAAAVADDELWFVSTRRARYDSEGATGLAVWKYGPHGWKSATVDDFVAADASLPTCFHVHGNRVSFRRSNSGGWQFYHRLVDLPEPRKPMRFVIFAWPSDQIAGSQRDDVRRKAVVAECHAYFLANLVDRLPAQARISFIGYSYGARLSGAALHLLGGGTVRGRTLANRTHDESRQVRAVFLAGALDSTHFLPGRAFQLAPTQLDYLVVARNPADHILKWYPALYRFTLRPSKSGPQAMGYVGLSGGSRIPELRFEHINVACLVGDHHDWHGLDYCRGQMLQRMRTCVTFAPLGKEPTAVVQTAAN